MNFQPSGFYQTSRAAVSKDTQNVLRELMRESKLTNFQQRHLERQMSAGNSFPVRCPSDHSYREKPKPVQSKSAPKCRLLKAGAGRRTKGQIEKTDAYDRPKFRPTPGKCISEKDKERLANIMAYGEEPKGPAVELDDDFEEPPEPDRFDELVDEIEDRRRFLEEMESLGRGKEYRTLINTEISQKLREMEIIDKQRTAELEKILATQK